MDKRIIFLLVAMLACTGSQAQNASESATQQASLVLSNAIEIVFNGTGTNTGSAVNLPFNTVANYTNGVTSAGQVLKVSSNMAFNVTVKANSANFTYTGSYTTGTTMPVSGVMKLKVTSNSTGGTIASPFNGFGNVTASNQNLINNGTYGASKLFTVQYKATPGFAYPAGTYTTTIVYTATQQ